MRKSTKTKKTKKMTALKDDSTVLVIEFEDGKKVKLDFHNSLDREKEVILSPIRNS